MSVSLGELAVRFGCELRGDPDVRVSRVAALSHAAPDAVAFLANAKYRRELASTLAGGVILDAASADSCPTVALIAANPHATFARIAAVLHPYPVAPAGVHASAVVAPDALVDPTAHVGPHVVIGASVTIGPRAFVGPGCVLQSGARLGADVRLAARVIVCHDVVIGARTLVQPGAVIGGDGFGFAPERGAWLKVPQVGTVRIGEDVEIGANTTIDRGAIEDTVIEDGVKLDNQIQIGHNVRIGAHTAMAACVGVSGSSTIGRRCQIGGAVGIAGHLSICDDVIVTGMSLVSHSITVPGVHSGAIPTEPASVWRRIVGRVKRLDSLAARVTQLERSTGVRASAANSRTESED